MTLDFEDNGSGPALVFLPGSYSTTAAWRGVLGALAGRYRVIVTSLPGYGGTREVRDPEQPDMAAVLGFVRDLSDRVGEPFHLVGHSFGGQIACAAALEGSLPIESLVTFEANPIYARLAGAPIASAPEVAAVTAAFEAALADTDPEAAGIIIDYWGSPGLFATMPEPVREFCRNTASVNLLDWRAAASFTPDLEAFSRVSVPTTIVRGEYANAAILELSDALVEHLQRARLDVVSGAGHFLTATHPGDCARIIDDHMRAVLDAPGATPAWS